MRLTAILLLGAFLQVSAEGYTQDISLTVKDVSLESALRQIQRQSGYAFLYSREDLRETKKVDLQLQSADIEEALQLCFEDQPLTYTIVHDERVVAIKRKPQSGKSDASRVQSIVRGIVTDTTGAPLPGVSVQVKESLTGTSTDMDGRYELSNVPPDATLVFAFLGYSTREVPVNGREQLNVQLRIDVASLEEVVVVGFGTQKKINLTGAVDQITSEVLENRPVANIGQALQGVIPNLNINISNGSPNTTPSINIRGGTSFGKNSSGDLVFSAGSPLVLVDGVEMDINQLNPEDIASISVLKDAASAAIYGARAAYGVVLVSTKKGRQSETPRLTYSNSFQWNKPSAIPDFLDAYTIQEAAIKAVELENRTPSGDMYEKLEHIKAYMDNPGEVNPYYLAPGGNIIWVGNTRVYDLAVRDYSPMQKHNLSLSGGGEKSSWYASLGYQGQEGLYRINTDRHNRYNAMLNMSTDVADWFSFEFRSSYNNTQYREPVSPAGKGGWWIAMGQEPSRNINMPVKTPVDSPVGEMYTDNILSFMDYGSLNEESEENLLLAASPVITPVKGWKIQTDFSYRAYNFNRKQAVPELSRIENYWDNPTSVHTSPSYVQRWKEHFDQFTLNAYTDYNYSAGNHNFYGLLGFNQEWYVSDYLGGRGENILSPNIPVIGQTLGNQYAYDAESHWAIRGGFYRFTYNYNEKYLFESNGRYDGTSRFPKDRRFKFFSSFSGAWRVTEEPFAQGIRPVVDQLKLRASYGSLGNQNVANYIYIPSYGTISEVQHLFDGIRPVGVTPPGLVDPDLTWETATTIDFGIDMTFFKRLDLSFDWYRRSTTDILVAGDKLPAVLGTGVPTKNSGEMKTTGWELSVDWRDGLKNGFNYNIAFNLSDYQSEIVTFGGNPNKLLSSLYVGQKMDEIWGYETVGIFQSQEEIDAAPTQEQISSGVWYPGDIRYRDLDGDGKIGPGANTAADPGDRRIIGNSTPRYRFGLNMNASWKGFDLNVFFQGVGKRDYWIGSNMYWGAIIGGTGTWEIYNNSWTPERRDAYYPAYKPKGANIVQQTRYLQNAAYIRLKNLALGYTFPRDLFKTIPVERLRIYAAAYNLWEYTKIPELFDPEVLSPNYPMMRGLAFGLQVSF